MKSKTKNINTEIMFSLPYALNTHMLHIKFEKQMLLIFERVLRTSYNGLSGFWQMFWYLILYLPLAIISNFAFPIFNFVVSKKKWDALNLFALVHLLPAFTIAFMLSEISRRTHMNFCWQISIVSSILFLTSLLSLFSNKNIIKRLTWANTFSFAIFAIHVFCGLLFLQKIIFLWDWR